MRQAICIRSVCVALTCNVSGSVCVFFVWWPGKTVFFVCWLVFAFRARASVYLVCVLCERVLACNGVFACTFAGGLPETTLSLSPSQTKNNLTNCFSLSLSPSLSPPPPKPPHTTHTHRSAPERKDIVQGRLSSEIHRTSLSGEYISHEIL